MDSFVTSIKAHGSGIFKIDIEENIKISMIV